MRQRRRDKKCLRLFEGNDVARIGKREKGAATALGRLLGLRSLRGAYFQWAAFFWLELVRRGRRGVTLTVDEKNNRRPRLPSVILSPMPGYLRVTAGPE